MTFLNANFETKQTIIKSLKQIADKLSKDIFLKINDTYYRLIDFEFYVYAKAMPDPHTYKHAIQLQLGKLYLHASGVDITFGDGMNYGGILLRSIVKINLGGDESNWVVQQYDGPQIVATELFSNLNSLLDSANNQISLIDTSELAEIPFFQPKIELIKTKRVGLSSKANDPNDEYKNLPLRHISILPKSQNFKQKIKGIERILEEQVIIGKLTIDDRNGILGYQRKLTQ